MVCYYKSFTMVNCIEILFILTMIIIIMVLYCVNYYRRSKYEGFVIKEENTLLKNSIYLNDVNGIPLFYSSGNTKYVDKLSLSFFPSKNDYMCLFGKNNTEQCNMSKMTIEHVSIFDTRTQFDDARHICTDILLSPHIITNHKDSKSSKVRIFTGIYDFSKTCLLLDVDRQQMSTMTYFVDPASYSCKIFFLLRPIFVRGEGMQPVHITHIDNYNSASKSKIPITFKNIPNNLISGSETKSLYVNIIKEFNDQAYKVSDVPNFVRIPMYLYYMNFVNNINAISDLPSSVLTLYITPETQVDNIKGHRINLSNSAYIVIYIKHNIVRLYNSINKLYFNVNKPNTNGSIVVITISSSLILMTSMNYHNGDIEMKRIGIETFASISTTEVTNAISLFPIPKSLYPYNNLCIPNLADIALRLQILR